MNCELCGKQSEHLNFANIEGSKMNVCNTCSKLGTKIRHVKTKPQNNFFKQNEANQKLLKKNYSSIMFKARQKKYDQESFAKKLGEKLSTIQRIEQGNLTPSAELIKKIEKELNITLTETLENDPETEFKPKQTSQTLTLGDIIKFKKR